MDIATYNQMEVLAKARLSSWRFQQIFSPVLFEHVGFPARIEHIGQVRGLLAGMHRLARIRLTVGELGGLQEDDLPVIAGALGSYLRWYRTWFSDESVPIPLGDLMAQFMSFARLSGIPERSRVLEIGPGYGLTSLFASGDPLIQTYDTIEITQSLYIMQSSLGRHCFGPGFRDAALPAENWAGVGALGGPDSSVQAHRPGGLKTRREFRSTLYPWWEIDAPLSQRYDVVVSNSNLAEMSEGALLYYLENWKKVLSDDGYVLVQDLGRVEHIQEEAVLRHLDRQGYRALVKFAGEHGGKRFSMWNLLLVAERHPAYARARSVLEPSVFLTDDETVRRVYRLDRPAGRTMSASDIFRDAVTRLGEPME